MSTWREEWVSDVNEAKIFVEKQGQVVTHRDM
jgi:hypothetical protein